MRCCACDKILSDRDLIIDEDYCFYCIKISNEARMELEHGERYLKEYPITQGKEKHKSNKDL